MSRVVWLDGRFVDPGAAALSIDDPAVRHGEGLFESMRSDDGVIGELDRHLARLHRSVDALDLAGTADAAAVAAAARAVAARFPSGTAKIRVTITPGPTLLAEGHAVDPGPLRSLGAITIRGAWLPERWLAEHKTLSYIGWRHAQRQAERAGAATALLLDREERMGEATTANVFVVRNGEILTAPARGLLPGTTRARVLERFAVTEHAASAAQWRGADEIFVTSAVSLVAGIGSIDGSPVGDGTPGPITRRVAHELDPGGGPHPATRPSDPDGTVPPGSRSIG